MSLPGDEADRRYFQLFCEIAPDLPSVALPGNEADRRYFQLFCDLIAPDLCGHYDAPFWTRLVLQECHRESAVRYQVLALSALTKSRSCSGMAKSEHEGVALVQQSKGLRALRLQLSGSVKQDIRLAVISSLIISCFESLHGNWLTAIEQLRSGIYFFRQWKNIRNEKASKRVERIEFRRIDSEIFPVMDRVDLQVRTYLALNPITDFVAMEGPWKIENMPIQFQSLSDAMGPMLHLFDLCLNHMHRCIRYKTSSNQSWRSKIHPALTLDREALSKSLNEFRVAFRPLVKMMSFRMTMESHIGSVEIDVWSQMLSIIAECSLANEETIFDGFLENFSVIVQLSTMMKEGRDKRALSGSRPLVYGIWFTIPLFYTATRCRNSDVRRAAIALLEQWMLKTGVWDGSQVSKVAGWVADIEGEGRDVDGSVPEEARVRMHTLKWTIRDDFLVVECTQGLPACPRKTEIPFPQTFGTLLR